MTTTRPARATLLVAVVLDAAAAGAFLLPWWHGPVGSWAGWEIAGGLRSALLVVLVVLAVLGAAVSRTDLPGRWSVGTRVVAVAAGATAATIGVSALIRWGITGAPGAWVAVVTGAVASALAGRALSHVTVSVALVVAVAVSVLPGTPPVEDGPARAGLTHGRLMP